MSELWLHISKVAYIPDKQARFNVRKLLLPLYKWIYAHREIYPAQGSEGADMGKRTQRRRNAYKELVKLLNWSPPASQSLASGEAVPEPVKMPFSPGYKFDEGHIYLIMPADGSDKGGLEADSIFRYEGKQGKHHCFREVRGGWTRTYTDAQLTEKAVKEVKP